MIENITFLKIQLFKKQSFKIAKANPKIVHEVYIEFQTIGQVTCELEL